MGVARYGLWALVGSWLHFPFQWYKERRKPNPSSSYVYEVYWPVSLYTQSVCSKPFIYSVDNTAFEIPRVTGKEHDDVTLANDAVMEIYVVRSEVNDGVIEFQNSVIDLSGASSEKESDEMRVDEVITEIFDVTSEEKDGVMEDGKGTTEISGLTIS